MLNKLNTKSVKLKWLTPAPKDDTRFSLLIPEYNEIKKCNIRKRLDYYNQLSIQHANVNVIIIDDGSTDGSLAQITAYLAEAERNIYVASVRPNSQKVGALFLTTLELNSEFIVLSDFDTDIRGLENIERSVSKHLGNPNFMGGYFRMLPYEGDGDIFLFQQLEYSLLRSLYKIHRRDRTVPVMPGAGCVYRRDSLIEIYGSHSGLRNGEDRESALIGQKYGLETFYMHDICTLTRPPLTVKNLLNQRVRWNLGYLETFNKEKGYYFTEFRNKSAMGIRFLIDAFVVIFLLLFPLLLMLLAFVDISYCFYLLVTIYVVSIVYCSILIAMSPTESYEFKSKKIRSVIFYPLLKFFIDYFAWMAAIKKFMKLKSENYYLSGFVNRN